MIVYCLFPRSNFNHGLQTCQFSILVDHKSVVCPFLELNSEYLPLSQVKKFNWLKSGALHFI